MIAYGKRLTGARRVIPCATAWQPWPLPGVTVPCPDCGMTQHEGGLRIASGHHDGRPLYMVKCLHCQHLGAVGLDADDAIYLWNCGA